MRHHGQDGDADETGVVRVVIDDSGAVRDVLIALTWRDSMRPGDLGPALCDAANTAPARHHSDRLDPEPEPALMVRADAPDAGGDPTGLVAKNLVNEVLDLLSRLDRDLDTYANRLERQVNHTATGMGPERGIVVTVTAGTFASVTVDSVWAASATPLRLRDEALSAFEEAQHEAATADLADVRPPESIARLRELASDPDALSRQLGLARAERNFP